MTQAECLPTSGPRTPHLRTESWGAGGGAGGGVRGLSWHRTRRQQASHLPTHQQRWGSLRKSSWESLFSLPFSKLRGWGGMHAGCQPSTACPGCPPPTCTVGKPAKPLSLPLAFFYFSGILDLVPAVIFFFSPYKTERAGRAQPHGPGSTLLVWVDPGLGLLPSRSTFRLSAVRSRHWGLHTHTQPGGVTALSWTQRDQITNNLTASQPVNKHRLFQRVTGERGKLGTDEPATGAVQREGGGEVRQRTTGAKAGTSGNSQGPSAQPSGSGQQEWGGPWTCPVSNEKGGGGLGAFPCKEARPHPSHPLPCQSHNAPP